MSYQIALDSFHGPLDLLLYLVKRNEVEILDISISHIAEQFIEFMSLMKTLDVELAGDFLVMAATLMEIKSRTLLPSEETEQEESEANPRRELIKQLLEYRKFKEAAAVLENRAEDQQSRISRDMLEEAGPNDGAIPIRRVELWDLVSAFGRLMRETFSHQTRSIVVDETPMHVYQAQIRARLQDEGPLSLVAILNPPFNRARLIGMFLAILEMIKWREVAAEQKAPFGEICLFLTPESPSRQ